MLEAAGLSDPGCMRSNNEDYYLVEPELGLYLVADGMGGARAGERASKLAAESVKAFIARAGGACDDEMLPRAFEEANRNVLETSRTDAALEGMGTTLVALLHSGERYYVASVGDSRAYLYFDGQLTAITEDQTWVNEVGRKLGIDEAQLKTHPMRHVLTMAIGVGDRLRVHAYTIDMDAGVEILLCSDGLHGVVGEEKLSSVLGSKVPINEKLKTLIGAAKDNGGPDNITAVIVRTKSN